MHSRARRRGRVAVFFVLLALVGLASVAAWAQGSGNEDDAALLQRGFDTYSAQCAGCHQPGGAGIPGTFPPLNGNPAVQDSAYLIDTIRNGREGALTVDGVDYAGVMPAFSTLSDEEVDGLVAYVQSGFVVPSSPGDDGTVALPVATGALPKLSSMAIVAAFALATAAGVMVLSPRIVSTIDRLHVPWLDAWLRSTIIVVYFVVATVVVPSAVLQTETVSRLDRSIQDVIGVSLWVGGLAVGLLGLWYSHRERRI
ncbi:MAG TPA: cytochrome c [Acidimicrobiia bacterium]